jgi:uridylate kinase
MQKLVMTIGGSVILSKDLEINYFKEFAILLDKVSKKYKIFLIIGGGDVARRYINLGRKLGFKEELLDLIGIDITRINAKFINNILNNDSTDVPHSIKDAEKIDRNIVVMGGTTPGHSTDMVGAHLAQKVNAELFIIATNVDGIFDKDPNKYNNAKQLKNVNIDQLIKNLGTKWNKAGKNIVIDGPALKIIKNAKLNTFVLNGKKLEELEKAINLQPFDGTRIIN